MDRHLSFEPHVNQLVGKCTGLLIGLSHARHRLPHDMLPSLVNGIVISLIRYCIVVCRYTATPRAFCSANTEAAQLLGEGSLGTAQARLRAIFIHRIELVTSQGPYFLPHVEISL